MGLLDYYYRSKFRKIVDSYEYGVGLFCEQHNIAKDYPIDKESWQKLPIKTIKALLLVEKREYERLNYIFSEEFSKLKRKFPEGLKYWERKRIPVYRIDDKITKEIEQYQETWDISKRMEKWQVDQDDLLKTFEKEDKDKFPLFKMLSYTIKYKRLGMPDGEIKLQVPCAAITAFGHGYGEYSNKLNKFHESLLSGWIDFDNKMYDSIIQIMQKYSHDIFCVGEKEGVAREYYNHVLASVSGVEHGYEKYTKYSKIFDIHKISAENFSWFRSIVIFEPVSFMDEEVILKNTIEAIINKKTYDYPAMIFISMSSQVSSWEGIDVKSLCHNTIKDKTQVCSVKEIEDCIEKHNRWQSDGIVPYNFLWYYDSNMDTKKYYRGKTEAFTMCNDLLNGKYKVQKYLTRLNQLSIYIKGYGLFYGLETHLNGIVFVCIPCENAAIYSKRFQSISKELCLRYHMENAMPHIIIGGGQTEYDKDFFKNKNIILFDVIRKDDKVAERYKDVFERMGAHVVCSLTICQEGVRPNDSHYHFYPPGW